MPVGASCRVLASARGGGKTSYSSTPGTRHNHKSGVRYVYGPVRPAVRGDCLKSAHPQTTYIFFNVNQYFPRPSQGVEYLFIEFVSSKFCCIKTMMVRHI